MSVDLKAAKKWEYAYQFRSDERGGASEPLTEEAGLPAVLNDSEPDHAGEEVGIEILDGFPKGERCYLLELVRLRAPHRNSCRFTWIDSDDETLEVEFRK